MSLLPPDCFQGSRLHLAVVLQEIVKSLLGFLGYQAVFQLVRKHPNGSKNKTSQQRKMFTRKALQLLPK
jgi:hypothetical protein